jgi:type II secretory pathway pseudopilin PulG
MGTCITGSWSGGRRAARGFSLAEVIVAVGIMAGALVALLGLLGPSLRAVRDIADRTVAARLADRVARELQQHGFRNVEMETAAGPLLVVASAEGSRVVLAVQADNDPVAGVPPGLPVNERFFLVEVERAVQPAAIGGDGALVLGIRVSWPYVPPRATAPLSAERRSWLVAAAVVTP